MNKIHYYVLIHQKNNSDAGDVLGFYSSKEQAEQAKTTFDNIPVNEIKIIETDSTLKKI